jgi:hypothetical protein
MSKEFPQLEEPLNLATAHIAKERGVPWNRKISITKSATQGEVHVGKKTCEIHPTTVVNADLPSLIDKILELSEMFISKADALRLESVEFEKERVREKCSYLQRALSNGDYEEFLKELER